MIPNIIHFVFGLKEQKEEFLFCYYISILSSKLVNNPEKIYFHYHFEQHYKLKDFYYNYLQHQLDYLKHHL